MIHFFIGWTFNPNSSRTKKTTARSSNNFWNHLAGLVGAFFLLAFILYIQSMLVIPDNRSLEKRKTAKLKNPGSVIIFHDADILFQRLPGDYSDHLANITGSSLTHCGLVTIKGKDIYVVESGEQKEMATLEEWIKKGVKRNFALMRMESLDEKTRKNIIEVGKKLSGRPYDYQYNWDDEKIYCSELVFKSFQRGAGIYLGNPVPLGSLNYRGHEKFIRQLTGGELPLDRKIITPLEIYRCRKLKVIYDDFDELNAEKKTR